MARVLLENVTKKFGDVFAVKDVNLEIQDKEFVVLVGPSGCGKTTTLRMVAGLEEISSGRIYIGDKLVNDVPPKDRNIAMVFQNYALYPHMKVYDNLAFGLRFRGVPKKEIDGRVKEAAEVLELGKLLDRLPKQLSGGQRQRVALGRALVRRPQVFLMDEPLSNLDAKLRVQMRAEIKKLHNRLQATIVYVTHDQVEAMTLGDRIAVILNGELQQAEGPLTIYDDPANRFVAGFIGSPPMNFMKGVLQQTNGQIHFEASDFSVPIPQTLNEHLGGHLAKEVVFGIRPEHIAEEARCNWTSDRHIVETRVDFRELMGSETYLYLKAGKTPLVVRVDAMNDAVSGSKFKVVLNLRKLHIFDAMTQETII